jgi:hypothetical protein
MNKFGKYFFGASCVYEAICAGIRFNTEYFWTHIILLIIAIVTCLIFSYQIYSEKHFLIE